VTFAAERLAELARSMKCGADCSREILSFQPAWTSDHGCGSVCH
jgi:hypothetical protein